MIDYNWVMSHKDIFKLIFTIVISISCFVIVSRTHRIFKLSENQGVRYFRNAFLFYGLAFIFRYVAYTSSKSVLGNYTKYSYNQDRKSVV